jgi:hypothetical protein
VFVSVDLLAMAIHPDAADPRSLDHLGSLLDDNPDLEVDAPKPSAGRVVPQGCGVCEIAAA